MKLATWRDLHVLHQAARQQLLRLHELWRFERAWSALRKAMQVYASLAIAALLARVNSLASMFWANRATLNDSFTCMATFALMMPHCMVRLLQVFTHVP